MKIFFKPHPSDIKHSYLYENALEENPHPFVMLESDDEIEPFLLSADRVATCFSTAGLDYDYLQYYSRRPLGRFLYLNIGKQIARTLEKIIGKAIVPGSENSTAIICRTRKELSTNLKYLKEEGLKYRCCKAKRSI